MYVFDRYKTVKMYLNHKCKIIFRITKFLDLINVLRLAKVTIKQIEIT